MDNNFTFYMLNDSNYTFNKIRITLRNFQVSFFSKFIFLTSWLPAQARWEKGTLYRKYVCTCMGLGSGMVRGPSVKVKVFQSDTEKQINLK